MRKLLANYAMCLAELPERDIIEAHRRTEARIRAAWHNAAIGTTIVSV